eukprot:6360802-Pyramimonas_sp.AAC.1
MAGWRVPHALHMPIFCAVCKYLFVWQATHATVTQRGLFQPLAGCSSVEVCWCRLEATAGRLPFLAPDT